MEKTYLLGIGMIIAVLLMPLASASPEIQVLGVTAKQVSPLEKFFSFLAISNVPATLIPGQPATLTISTHIPGSTFPAQWWFTIDGGQEQTGHFTTPCTNCDAQLSVTIAASTNWADGVERHGEFSYDIGGTRENIQFPVNSQPVTCSSGTSECATAGVTRTCNSDGKSYNFDQCSSGLICSSFLSDSLKQQALATGQVSCVVLPTTTTTSTTTTTVTLPEITLPQEAQASPSNQNGVPSTLPQQAEENNPKAGFVEKVFNSVRDFFRRLFG